MNDRIGFMQGRLSPLINGRIQSFPWPCWRDEFISARELNIGLMEWTLDQDNLYQNPLMTIAGQSEIRALCAKYSIGIPSMTGDCFMQAPLWKARGLKRALLERDFIEIAKSCSAVGISMMILPLVDNGSLQNQAEEDYLVDFLGRQINFLKSIGVKVLFESDYVPQELARFIERLPTALFGVNYDIGNSAALGFKSSDEFGAYGNRILNVHVKDRELYGSTVPLGTGNANFENVFSELARIKYQGKFILQTARSNDGLHATVLGRYRDMTAEWLNQYAS